MEYKTVSGRPDRFRLLISGFPNSGKTTSLQTFIYGPYDYETQMSEAIEYAGQRHMVIISCPGEFGIRSLPADSECLTSYYPEGDEESSVEWSEHAVNGFHKLYTEVKKQKPDILAIDGLHALWEQQMNVVTNGAYLRGEDLNINERTGTYDPYTSARFHSEAHRAFGQMLAEIYVCSIPIIVATTWEDWEGSIAEESKDQAGKVVAIQSKRYLWPSIPGKMAKAVVGRFDARVSARLETRCLHQKCEDSKKGEEHFVWQFASKGDVRGVGIKGLKLNKQWQQHPFIHQRWDSLQALINAGRDNK